MLDVIICSKQGLTKESLDTLMYLRREIVDTLEQIPSIQITSSEINSSDELDHGSISLEFRMRGQPVEIYIALPKPLH